MSWKRRAKTADDESWLWYNDISISLVWTMRWPCSWQYLPWWTEFVFSCASHFHCRRPLLKPRRSPLTSVIILLDQGEPASFGLIVQRTEDTISAVLLVYRCLVRSVTSSHSSQGWTIRVMPSESKYSFSLCLGTTDVAFKAMLSVSGLRNISSLIASLDNSVARTSDETALPEKYFSTNVYVK